MIKSPTIPTATMENITTDQYRHAAKELFQAMSDESMTKVQLDNGLKCLSLMYFALDEVAEFGDSKMTEWKRADNSSIWELASKRRLEWVLKRGLDIAMETV